MNISTLIDTLQQELDTNGDLPVVLSTDDFEGEGDFLALDFIMSEES